MRTKKLKVFIDGVRNLDLNNRDVTYYNLRTSKLDLSNKLILDCLKFCLLLGFMNVRKVHRGKREVKLYYKRPTWLMLEYYVKVMLEDEYT